MPSQLRLAFGPALIAAAFVLLAALPAPSEDKPPSKQQEIADLERQIEALTKRLQELRRADANPAPEGALPESWVKQLSWRCIGPATMGGRITALAVCESDPCVFWVATASGGLLKTTNGGTTFEHQFDRQATVSIGDVAVAPSDPNIVWVGTGENNPRNSVSWGDGVYKSTDGGKTWTHMGLPKTYQIGKIAIHPKDPNTVYVGALGRLWGPNEDRGLFKTTDGGKTWQKVLYIDDKTGVIDLRMHPADPETLLVATWERQRDGFDSHPGNEVPIADGYDGYDPGTKWGPGSGIHKTTDGGKTWKKLTKGLPTNNLGRIGLDYSRKDPNVVFAVIDCEKIGMGTPPPQPYLGVQGEDAPGDGAKLTSVAESSPAAKAGLKVGDVIKAIDKKPLQNFAQLGETVNGKKPGDKVTLRVERGKETLEVAVTIENRPPPGGVFLGLTGQEVEGGVRIAGVADESPAAKAGLHVNDVVLAIDKKEVKETRQLVEAMRGKKAGDKVTLQVRRDNEVKEVVVTLADRPAQAARRPYTGGLGGQRENAQGTQGPDGFQYGGVYKSTDGGESWERVNSLNPRPMYFSQIRVDPSDHKFVYVLGIALYRSQDGGKSFKPDGHQAGLHLDQHALWIDPKDGRHMVVGTDGGVYVTRDRMAHWDFLNTTALGQFYHVAVDTRRPYHVYGGLQDNGTWGGPSHSLSGPGPTNADWMFVNGGDGFQCQVDPSDSDLVYSESQGGAMARLNLRTGERKAIRPQPPPGKPPYRFNWNTPFLLSHHNPQIFYCGGNYVFRSVKRGDDLRAVSPEITRTKRGSASALAESPRSPDVLWAGSDDGFLWVTRDGGATWTNVTDKVGLPGPRWVSSIEASRFADGRAYVAFDGHRSDDDQPHVYVTEDYGQTWKPLRANLPPGSSRVLREDVANPNLLYLGTEFAVWASLDRGATWTRINNNLPTVAVHEIAVHPMAGEIVAATHGRSLWVLDVTTLRQLTPEALKAPAALYRPNTAVRWRSEPGRGSVIFGGSRHYVGQNPPPGAHVYYSLTKKAEKASLKIVDYAGKTVKELEASKEPGLHHVAWDLTRMTERRSAEPVEIGPETPAPRRGRAVQQVAQAAPPGQYRVVLTVDGQEYSQPLRVEADPTLAPTIIAEGEEP